MQSSRRKEYSFQTVLFLQSALSLFLKLMHQQFAFLRIHDLKKSLNLGR
jgi:hypothetical protein